MKLFSVLANPSAAFGAMRDIWSSNMFANAPWQKIYPFLEKTVKETEICLRNLEQENAKLRSALEELQLRVTTLEKSPSNFRDSTNIPQRVELLSFWDRFNENLINSGTEMIKIGEDGWNSSALGKIANPRSFTIKLHHGPNTMIGLATRDKFNPNSSNYSSCGWYLCCFNGNLYSASDSSRNFFYYDKRVPPLSEIEVLWDRSAQTISFVINGENCGIAFRKVNVGSPLHPAIDLYDKGTKISVLACSLPP
eukprot:TRINITY_DN9336_c0_g1_i2.p1 TRINITY_DN9336_c0_g1~~TRINITY_DN9336_c0_g1_i2.p1  ORF type:complete len:252 (-),score=40.49 TRINITY_DN9336_c0_g1_i2:134-889(-)